MPSTNLSIRIDMQLKKEAEEVFSDFGMSLTSAFVCFVRQTVREQRLPFTPSRRVPNRETIEAMEEVRRLRKDKTGKRYAKFSDLLSEIKAETDDEP
ncbi:MAG: type II toxin-antitoxin system RelB/DinJ family antitoxin [bacterium]